MFVNIIFIIITIIIETWLTYEFYGVINKSFSKSFKVAVTITYIGLTIILIMGLISSLI